MYYMNFREALSEVLCGAILNYRKDKEAMLRLLLEMDTSTPLNSKEIERQLSKVDTIWLLEIAEVLSVTPLIIYSLSMSHYEMDENPRRAIGNAFDILLDIRSEL